MCPCPSAARLAPGNQLIRQEQRRGCFLKANNKQSCFFFPPHFGGRPGWFRVRVAQPRRPRGAGQGRMRGPGRRSPRPPAQPRSGRSPWQRARGGEGPGGVGCRGCYFGCFLFLAATSPWQRCYSPRPLPGSAGARDPGRPRPLVSHLLGCRSPPPPASSSSAPRTRPCAPASHPSRLPSRLCRFPRPGRELD